MEITYAEFCELLELSPEQIEEFATWQARYTLADGVSIGDCKFKIGGWWFGWEIFANAGLRAEFEMFVRRKTEGR